MEEVLLKRMLQLDQTSDLSHIGERILADRYLVKDTSQKTLGVGSLVVALLDTDRSYSDLARVVSCDPIQHVATVELRDGFQATLPFSKLNVLEETSPTHMWKRIAHAASVVTSDQDVWQEKFYWLQSKWRYIPGGRINASLGTGVQTTSYNCFVIPNVGHSMQQYAESVGQTLEILARSGGVGMNLSQVPPQGSIYRQYETIQPANLQLVLDVWHPDIPAFLEESYPNCTKLVRVSDAFLQAVAEHDDWALEFPDTTNASYCAFWKGDLQEWKEQGLPVYNSAVYSAVNLYRKMIEQGVLMIQDTVGMSVHPPDRRIGIARSLSKMWEGLEKQLRVSVVLSSLRPYNAYVQGINGRSAGAVGWAKLYDVAHSVYANGFGPVGIGEIMSKGCEITLQSGSRSGALMLILNDRHPDLLKFISCKQQAGVIHFANLSVGVSEAFMEAQADGTEWNLAFPYEHELKEFQGDFESWHQAGRDLRTYQVLKADALWDAIMTSAWTSAEPGVVFLERYNQMSNSHYFNPIIATNPCGEQGLPAYGICNLGAVVLSTFANGFVGSGNRSQFSNVIVQEQIREDLVKHFDAERAEFLLHHVKWEELEETVRIGIRFQDAVIDATYYPFEENRKNQLDERRVGLGIMGLHDLLIYCGIRYGSPESIAFVDVLFGKIAEWSYLESVELAKEQGPFSMFDAEQFLNSGYMQQMAIAKPHVTDAIREHGVRNVTTMTIAPTGTTGTMIGCATGCEPYFAWKYWRNSRMGLFEERAKIVEDFQHVQGGQAELPDYFVTAMELTPEEHVNIQAALQKWIDSSISKTCNVPEDYSIEDTKRLYELAYRQGCKGITIYRNHSRSEQVLSLQADEQQGSAMEQIPKTEMENVKHERKYQHVLYGTTYQKDTPLGTASITVNESSGGDVCEVIVRIGKLGSEVYTANAVLGQMISLYLSDSHRPDKLDVVIDQLLHVAGANSVGFGERRITSVADAIAKVLLEHQAGSASQVIAPVVQADSQPILAVGSQSNHKDLCPQCHQFSLIRQSGCSECEACGYSKC